MISAACSGKLKKSERRKATNPAFFLQRSRFGVNDLLLKFTSSGGFAEMVSVLFLDNRAIVANAKRSLGTLQWSRDVEAGY